MPTFNFKKLKTFCVIWFFCIEKRIVTLNNLVALRCAGTDRKQLTYKTLRLMAVGVTRTVCIIDYLHFHLCCN